FAGTVLVLLTERIVKPTARVGRVERLRDLEQRPAELAALLLRVNFAGIAADRRVLRVERDGKLHLLSPRVALPLAVQREGEADARIRIRLVGQDAIAKARFGFGSTPAAELDEAEHDMAHRELRIETHRTLRRFSGAAVVLAGEAQLRNAGPRVRVLGRGTSRALGALERERSIRRGT